MAAVQKRKNSYRAQVRRNGKSVSATFDTKREAIDWAAVGKTTVAIPIGTTDGAAESLYYTAPVTIAGLTKDGRPVRIEGEAVLRRVNDVDGATSALLRWHFETLSLAWVH